jgi:hypothetical protein
MVSIKFDITRYFLLQGPLLCPLSIRLGVPNRTDVHRRMRQATPAHGTEKGNKTCAPVAVATRVHRWAVRKVGLPLMTPVL